MNNNKSEKMQINKFLKIGSEMGYWDRGYGFPILCKQIFSDNGLQGKNILEIGCGKGVFCIWASLKGAKNVVGLEPLEEGAYDANNIFDNFKKITEKLQLSNIKMIPEKIQDFNKDENLYDIVLSVASINHLDEENCIIVKNNSKARKIYQDIFKGISNKMKPGGKLIILDCSNMNFFNSINIKNPLAKTIEWFKHQTPEFWADLLMESGFKDPIITWPTGKLLRYMGIYNRKKIIAYFLDSAFRLELTRI